LLALLQSWRRRISSRSWTLTDIIVDKTKIQIIGLDCWLLEITYSTWQKWRGFISVMSLWAFRLIVIGINIFSGVEIIGQLSECVSITTMETLPNSVAHIFIVYFLLHKLERLQFISLIRREDSRMWVCCFGDIYVFFWLFIQIPLPSRLHFYFEI